MERHSTHTTSDQRTLYWHGILQRDEYNPEPLETRDEIANAAKAYDWRTLLRLLEENPELVNTWRVGGESWYAPLHQAAHGGAPKDIVEKLVALRAWRTLRTAKNELPIDIARRRGHDHLVAVLEPKPVHTVDAHVLEGIQGHFHEVIRERIASIDGVLKKLRLPELGPVTEETSAPFWFAVPGMYGGFSYRMAVDAPRPTLVAESWCRVVEGSGQRHEVTAEGVQLVAEGFV